MSLKAQIAEDRAFLVRKFPGCFAPKGMPKLAYVGCVEVSPHDAKTVYVAATRFKAADYKPYLFRTDDEGWGPLNDIRATYRQDASGNRLALGVGLSHRFFIENSLGLDYSRPIPHTREYLTVLNGLLAGETVRFEGELYRVKAQVTVGSAPPPPVLVAALGPAMLRLCGRLADGTITWMGGIDYLRDVAVPTMSAAAEAAGRPAPRFVAMVPVLLSDDDAAGRDLVNETFTMYGRIPSYRATLDRGGASEPADVAVIGDADAVAAGLNAFASVGVTDFAAVVPRSAPSAAATTELLSELARAARPGAGAEQ